METIEEFTTPEFRFLSNFYPHLRRGTKYPIAVRVVYNDIEFDCVECAYQAAKFESKEVQESFSHLTPLQVKAYCDKHSEYRDDWNEIKLSVMANLVEQKFTNSAELKEMLLNTGDAILIEGNTWGDTYWGVCDGIGENHLGKILMAVRNQLQSQ